MPPKTTERPSAKTTPAAGTGAGSPMLTPEQLLHVLPTDGKAATNGSPALQPPGTAAGTGAQAAIAGAGVFISVVIGGLWTNNSQSNGYAYLNGVGWRRLSGANPAAHHCLVQLARLAKDTGATVQCDDDGSVIHAIYHW
jgi:hypothetical protein